MSLEISSILTAITIVEFIAFGGVGVAVAQQEEAKDPSHHATEQMSSPMMDECKSMMSTRKQAQAEMKAAGEKLDALLATMSTADGHARMVALANVVAELATQQQKMTSMVMGMRPQMMEHMMRHMQMAMAEGNADAMECPMMKEIHSNP